MRSIAHCAAGVAVASCFSQAVHDGAAGHPLYFLLAAAFSLLPDAIDRVCHGLPRRCDVVAQPDPLRPDPRIVAAGVAAAAERARSTGRPVHLQLGVIRPGAGLRQRYTVGFDVARRRVVVTMGPVVDAGGRRVGEASASLCRAEAALAGGIRLAGESEVTVDREDGPVVRLVPQADGRIEPALVLCHGQRGHGVPVGAVAALGAGLVWGPLAACIALLAFMAHVGADQLARAGVRAWYPFSRRRPGGPRRRGADSILANIAMIQLSGLLMFWNLARAAGQGPFVPPVRLLFFGAAVPLMLYRLLAGGFAGGAARAGAEADAVPPQGGIGR